MKITKAEFFNNKEIIIIFVNHSWSIFHFAYGILENSKLIGVSNFKGVAYVNDEDFTNYLGYNIQEINDFCELDFNFFKPEDMDQNFIYTQHNADYAYVRIPVELTKDCCIDSLNILVDFLNRYLNTFDIEKNEFKGCDNKVSVKIQNAKSHIRLFVSNLKKAGYLEQYKPMLEVFCFNENEMEKITSVTNWLENHKTDIPNKKESFNSSSNFSSTSIDINLLIKMLEDKFIGQEKVIEAIVSNIYTNQKIIDLNDKTLLELNKTSILLDGSTGTGKTAIIKDIADNIGVPIIITNPSNYSSTGYVGASLSDILVELLKKANGDLKLAERGIVCFDEIDKLGGYDKSRRLEMKSAIQRELLTLIGGTIYEINYNDSKINFDTSKITFFGLGAFTDIRDIKMNKNSTKKIGFNNDNEEENTYVITEQDYIDYGLERELMGRFKVILYTKDYSINDYKNILLNSSISPLKGFIDTIKLLSDNTIEVTYSDDFVDAVAFSAYNDKFGARGVQKIMSTIKSYFLKRILCKEIQKINLTADLLNELKEMSIRKF